MSIDSEGPEETQNCNFRNEIHGLDWKMYMEVR
jgi:hypothetical protein